MNQLFKKHIRKLSRCITRYGLTKRQGKLMYTKYTITLKSEQQMQEYCESNGKSLSLLETRKTLSNFCRGYILTSSSKRIVMDLVDDMLIITLSLPICPKYQTDYQDELAMLNYFTYGSDVNSCIFIDIDVVDAL